MVHGARQFAPVGDIGLVDCEIERLLQPFFSERAKFPVPFPVQVIDLKGERGVAAPERRGQGTAERRELFDIFLSKKHPVGVERVEILVEQPFGKILVERLFPVVAGREKLCRHLRNQPEFLFAVSIGVPAGGGDADLRGGKLRRPQKKGGDRTCDPDGE